MAIVKHFPNYFVDSKRRASHLDRYNHEMRPIESMSQNHSLFTKNESFCYAMVLNLISMQLGRGIRHKNENA